MRDVHCVSLLARRPLTTRTVRLTLGGPSLVGLAPRPAQDIEVLLRDGHGAAVKRRYTVRHTRPDLGEWDVDVVVHDTVSPGSSWAAGAEIGSPVRFVGPRGKLELRAAGRQLFVGDEASLPAIAALTEALPAGVESTAIVEIGSPDDQLPLPGTDAYWLIRERQSGDSAAVDSTASLCAAVERMVQAAGFDQAYVLTEAHTTLVLRRLLSSHGLQGDRVFAKGYWTRRDLDTASPSPTPTLTATATLPGSRK